MKTNSLTVLAIALAAILIGAASESEANPYIEIGGLFESAEASMGGIGYIYKDKWDANLSYIGEGEDDWGNDTPKVKVMSITRMFNPGWIYNRFIIGVGVAKLEPQGTNNLTGQYNYKIVMGFKTGKRSRIYIHHYSSFDINEQNTGINAITFRVDL